MKGRERELKRPQRPKTRVCPSPHDRRRSGREHTLVSSLKWTKGRIAHSPSPPREFSPSSTAVTAAPSFVKVTRKKTPDVLPDLNRRCFQEGHGRPRPACVIRDRDVGRRAASIPVRALLWFFRSISPQRARPTHRPRRRRRRRNEHARPI